MGLNPMFTGKGIRITSGDIIEAANDLGVSVAALQAVMDVEARSNGFYKSGAPTMLYEPHIAYARTRGEVRTALINAGVAYSKWGLRKYPSSYVDRYTQLEKAIRIAGDKAYEFASYGLPQMMGFNYKAAGFQSAKDMFNAFKISEGNQLRGMVAFIKANPKMHSALKRLAWKTFAYYYNGSGYAKNQYDVKLAAAYVKRLNNPLRPAGALDDGFLGLGDKGQEVELLQINLNQLGFGPLEEDGDFGPMTKQAVMDFQKSVGLLVDGKAGTVETLPAVERAVASLPSTVAQPEAGKAAGEAATGGGEAIEGGENVDPVEERVASGPDTPDLADRDGDGGGFWAWLLRVLQSIG